VVGERLGRQLLDQLLDPGALARDIWRPLALRTSQIIEKSVQLVIEAMFAMKTHGVLRGDQRRQTQPAIVLSSAGFPFSRSLLWPSSHDCEPRPCGESTSADRTIATNDAEGFQGYADAGWGAADVFGHGHR
jgi:hypothetical protein